MEGEELPPVIAVFKADIADFMAKVEEVKLALDSIGNQRSGFAQVERDASSAAREIESGFRRATDDAGRSVTDLGNRSEQAARGATTAWDRWLAKMETMFPEVRDRWSRALGDFRTENADAAQKMESDFRKAFQTIVESDAKKAFADMENMSAQQEIRMGRSLDRTQKQWRDTTNKMAMSQAKMWQDAAKEANKAIDQQLKDLDKLEAELAKMGGGGNGASNFIGRADQFFKGMAGWQAAVAGTLPIIPNVAAGLAYPLVGGAEAAAPGVFGSAAMYPFLKDAMGEVTKAATTLETQTNKYNTAADSTARYLQSDSQAMSDFKTLLGQVTPAQADMLNQLQQQDVTWGSLTTSQQNAVIQLRDTQGLYKVLPKSVQDEVNALLAEKAAWDNLEPAQAQALNNYQQMHAVYDSLRTQAMPDMFGTIASAEQAAADAMRPLLPVIQAAAAGWKTLFDGLDSFLTSPEYKNFIGDMAGFAQTSIEGFGRALGDVALGFMRIGDALSPMAGPFLGMLDGLAAKFANWPQTPQGMADLTHFMQDLERNGPALWSTLGNIAKFLGQLVAALAWDPLPLIVMKDITAFITDVAHIPYLGDFAIQITAWALALGKLASSMGLLAKAQEALGASSMTGALGSVMGRITGGAAAAGAAGAGVTIPGAAAAGASLPVLGETSAVGAGGAGLLAGLGAGGIAALLGAPLLVAGIASYVDQTQKASLRAKNLMTDAANGNYEKLVASDSLPASFKQFADNIGKQAQSTANVVQASDAAVSARFGLYKDDWSKNNDAVRAVMNFSGDSLGRSFAEFDAKLGGDVVTAGDALGRTGKSLSQLMVSQANTIFVEMGKNMPGFWQGLAETSNKQSRAAFDSMEKQSASDYTNIQSKYKQWEDDLTHGRLDNAKHDLVDVLGPSMQQFMNDAVSGNINNANKQIATLGKDIQAYFTDLLTDPTGQKAAADLAKLGKDISAAFDTTSDKVDASANQRISLELQAAQLDFSQAIQQATSNPLGIPGRASGGMIQGPGTSASDSILARLSAGEFVVNAKSTAANRPLLEAINRGFASGGFVDVAGPRFIDTLKVFRAGLAAQVIRDAAQSAAAAVSGGVSGTAAQWISQAMRIAGVSGADWANGLGIIISHESSGNPNAINLTDSNAAMGDPSRGLMQEIGATFNAYHVPGTSSNIFDPIANIAAGIRYIEGRYGGIDNVPGVRSIRGGGGYLPYDSGGWLMPGVSAALNMTGKPEAVLTNSQWQAVESLARGGGDIVIHNVVELDGKTVWENQRRVNQQQQRRNGNSTWNYSNKRIL